MATRMSLALPRAMISSGKSSASAKRRKPRASKPTNTILQGKETEQDAHALSVRQREVATINALIKRTNERDDGLQTLRERRLTKSMSTASLAPKNNGNGMNQSVWRPSVSQAELEEVNDLIANPNKLRSRRASKKPNGLSVVLQEESKVEQVEQTANDNALQDGAGKIVLLLVNPEVGEPSPTDVITQHGVPSATCLPDKCLLSTQALKGAAARGIKAAAMAAEVSQVKQAAACAGGIFLSAEQWDAVKAERQKLAADNKRLINELAEARAAAELKANQERSARSPSPQSPSRLLRRSLAKMRATAASSPVAHRAEFASVSMHEDGSLPFVRPPMRIIELNHLGSPLAAAETALVA